MQQDHKDLGHRKKRRVKTISEFDSSLCSGDRWLIICVWGILYVTRRKDFKKSVSHPLPLPWTQKNVWQGANIKHKCFCEEKEEEEKHPATPPRNGLLRSCQCMKFFLFHFKQSEYVWAKFGAGSPPALFTRSPPNYIVHAVIKKTYMNDLQEFLMIWWRFLFRQDEFK